MALEWRKNRRYYYRSVRVGKRVEKRYHGGGKAAALIAQFEAVEAEQRKLARWEERDRAERRRRKTAAVVELIGRANRLVAEALRASGWHQHKREWRKKRGATMTGELATMIDTWVPAEIRGRAGALDPAVEKQAQEGDKAVLPVVNQYLDNPAAVALWGDSGRRLLGWWVRRYAGSDLLVEQAMFRFASELRSGLTAGDPDPLVRLLAERVVIAWVAVSYFERWYARALEKDLSPPIHQHHQRTVDFAHRQLLAAARTLAKVRRTKLPEVLALVNVVPTPVAG